jgi:hypothetical protein
VCVSTNASSSSKLGFETFSARRSIKRWFTMVLDIIYVSPCSLFIILIKNSSTVSSLFALKALIHLGIWCDFLNKFLQHLVKYIKEYFIIHHVMHIWSSISPKDQENFKFTSWFKEVDQRKSTGQNWGSLDPISYKFCNIKMIPR